VYKLEYLPLAKQDMVEIARYINKELHNPLAAENLTVEMIKAAERLVDFPYSKAVYISPKPLKREYRRLAVKNYIMFYWVNEMEKSIVVARVVYARRDFDNLLN
jgi:plasmid stabilization system protein ParE